MVTIEFDPSLSNSAMYEHICLENMKKFYKSAGKYDDQQRYKAVNESSMVCTPVLFTDNSPISPSQYVTVKIPSARKSLHQFLDILEVKPKTGVRRFCAAKSDTKQSDLELCCGPVYQIGDDIQK